MNSVLSACFLISLSTLSTKAQDRSRGWGSWGLWSTCSRTCGVGITQRTRNCSYNVNGKPACQGENVQYKTCNTQDCKQGSRDFRSEQCELFNSRPFRDRYYQWEPYLPGHANCMLHCMPKTRRFYVSMTPKVIDGTMCDKDPYKICVNGKCLSIGCDRVLGSNTTEDNCRVCKGNNHNCVTHKGLFNETGDGYKEFLILPRGSTNIRIEEVGYSDHFLAMTDSSGNYLFNGDYRIINSKDVPAAGTTVEYKREYRSPEKVYVKGPLTEPLHAVILLRDSRMSNPGVTYEFSLPSSVTTLPPTATFSWRVSRYTRCTASCAGGQQRREVTCFREPDNIKVDAIFCNTIVKPTVTRQCNTQPCPARWQISRWGVCSRTCGQGQQFRQVQCMNIINQFQRVALPDNRCPGAKPINVRPCQGSPSCLKWLTEDWSACSSSCGEGVSTRLVYCVSASDPRQRFSDSLCNSGNKPQSQKQCFNNACPPMWLANEWSDCSKTCGNGTQTRKVMCVKRIGIASLTELPDNECNIRQKLTLSRHCSIKPCRARWEVLPWQQCSHSCGIGVQKRVVRCMTDTEEDCSNKWCNKKTQPPSERRCFLQTCSATEIPTQKSTSSTTPTRLISTTAQPTRMNDSPARIKEGPRNVINLLGRDVSFRCRAAGIPSPLITWRKGSDQLRQSAKHQIFRDGTLRINSVTLSDAGRYTCVAFNGVGTPARSSANLIVHDPPRVRISGDTTVNEGARISISCTITGSPRPIANWYKDGNLLYVSNSRGVVTRTLVTINKAEPSDSGTYECSAVHDSGRDQDSMTLTVLQRATPTPTVKCIDDSTVSRCSLVKRIGYCIHGFYKKACCKTCSKERRQRSRG